MSTRMRALTADAIEMDGDVNDVAHGIGMLGST